jgi:hypothetical protein
MCFSPLAVLQAVTPWNSWRTHDLQSRKRFMDIYLINFMNATGSGGLKPFIELATIASIRLDPKVFKHLRGFLLNGRMRQAL